MSKENLYNKKEQEYFSNIRWEIIEEVPSGNHRVLEIGCGKGFTAAELKKSGRAGEVIGIEIDAIASAEAAKKLDKVIVGDIESLSLPFGEEAFDIIILGDVLEHLVDPWKVLKRLSALIKKNGLIIASLPNVRYWRVSLPLVFFGKFDYRDSGIMDTGHLRFFTKQTIKKLFDGADLAIIKYKTNRGGRARYLNIASNILTLNLAEDLFVTQFIIVSGRKH